MHVLYNYESLFLRLPTMDIVLRSEVGKETQSNSFRYSVKLYRRIQLPSADSGLSWAYIISTELDLLNFQDLPLDTFNSPNKHNFFL